MKTPALLMLLSCCAGAAHAAGDRQLDELGRLKAEIAALRTRSHPLVRRLEALRRAYDSGADPSSLAEERRTATSELDEKMTRIEALRKDFVAALEENERAKLKHAVIGFLQQKAPARGARGQYDAHQELLIFIEGVEEFQDQVRSLQAAEKAEFKEAARRERNRRALLTLLAAAGLAAPLFLVLARRKLRVLAQPAHLPRAGEPSYVLLGGSYRLIEERGRDGLGILYSALDLRGGGRAQVWLLRQDSGLDPERVRAAADAARRAAGVRHPSIQRIVSILREDDRLCLVLEPSGGERLAAHLRSGKPEPMSLALRVVEQAAAALDCAHAGGALHGRLVPGSLLLSKDGGLVVQGLGLPQEASPEFLAPEQAAGILLPASDQFSLGACAYSLLSGNPPFPGPDHGEQKRLMRFTLPSRWPIACGELDGPFRTVLAPDPARRYPSCSGFASALASACAKVKRRRSGR